jgi:hypothetical protein
MTNRPVALSLTLCDYVIIEERTKKASLIGSFTGLAARSFPAIAQPFSVFAVLTDGLGDGIMELVILRLETGEQTAVYRTENQFPDKLTEVRYHLRLRQCRFPASGKYQFTLLADGEWVAQCCLRVYLGGRIMSVPQSPKNLPLQPGDAETVTESLNSVDVYAEGVMVIPMPSFPLEKLRKIRPDQPPAPPDQSRNS